MKLFLLLFAAALLSAHSLTSDWVVAKSSHFEVYSHSGAAHATALLQRMEELNAFFAADTSGRQPLRVIAFDSKSEYEAFKIRATADAYFRSNGDRNYIVMSTPRAGNFGVAAHEYAHFVLHSAGLHLPAWLSEGIAEVFSTVTISDRKCQLGGAIPAHVAILRHQSWLPIQDLVAHDSPAQLHLFYAESWALAETLVEDPDYSGRFINFIHALQDGSFNPASQHSLLAAAQAKLARNDWRRQTLPGVLASAADQQVAPVSEFESGMMIADLLLANGELERAAQAYNVLLRQNPGNANILGALGTVSLQKGHQSDALAYWKQALDSHVTDAALCYRYAVLADEVSASSAEIQRALEAAIKLDPHFEDARWRLGLFLSNQGNFTGALMQLHAMQEPTAERAYAYWTAIAYAENELGNREEAGRSVQRALPYAKTAEERTRASQIGYEAATDLAVRFTRDAAGNLQMVTTRVPHGTADFNPFIEPGDKINVAAGSLREVQCSAGRLMSLVVESNGALLKLSVPDPFHILIRNGPSQFNCGVQSDQRVTVEYAAAAKPNEGILRGMKF